MRKLLLLAGLAVALLVWHAQAASLLSSAAHAAGVLVSSEVKHALVPELHKLLHHASHARVARHGRR